MGTIFSTLILIAFFFYHFHIKHDKFIDGPNNNLLQTASQNVNCVSTYSTHDKNC